MVDFSFWRQSTNSILIKTKLIKILKLPKKKLIKSSTVYFRNSHGLKIHLIATL